MAGVMTDSPRSLAGAAVLAVALVACGSGGSNGSATTIIPTTIMFTVPPSSPPTSTPTSTGSSAAAATLATPTVTTAPAPATLAPETATLPTDTTTTTTTTTTEPLAIQELVLTGDGIGSAAFGADPEAVIEYVTSILGGNTADTGWVDPFSFAACDGSIARRVDWGVLSLLFTDQSPIANGRRHFIGYEYGRVGQIGDEPVGLRTPGGVTLGSRVVDVLAEFPEAAVNPGDPEVGFPDNFYVSNLFYGLLTGVTVDDYVTVLFGGYGCGE
jgi:hypothetical protein